ncbi:hypothetical protein M422DRAFT_34440 [Sphaerobolus stellatus SS14]|uniref:Uncharacterized protein n=1 Tax=Sphaerobolus stellatus (strain SS14) TaxID=990650 RepID=A0A0C9U031_SPHS4|nr:hypothetical protein M422DRAFT_34440 [Sphaerobolus stellatus SS14]
MTPQRSPATMHQGLPNGGGVEVSTSHPAAANPLWNAPPPRRSMTPLHSPATMHQGLPNSGVVGAAGVELDDLVLDPRVLSIIQSRLRDVQGMRPAFNAHSSSGSQNHMNAICQSNQYGGYQGQGGLDTVPEEGSDVWNGSRY